MLHKEKLHCLYSSSKIFNVITSRILSWADHLSRTEESRSTLKILTDKFPGRVTLGISRRKWERNIRIDLKEIGVNTRNWINSVQDRDFLESSLNAAFKLRIL